ncbi:MAG: insulinase family protein [Pseudomonadales bacterium]|nr:insulinase family protein [Pseudomonadales bacterium]
MILSRSHFRFLLFLFSSLFLVAVHAAVEVEKSPNDLREYRYTILENRMQVLLISDPEAEKEAVALDINIGSGDDPADRPGMAHFLEHMLFLGTGKYPDAGEYQAYITRHGGSHNAFTSLEHTNYFFDIQSGFLEPALDRFSQFFIAPLFNEEFVSRERNAVHSEFMARVKDESRRSQDVYREIYNPKNKIARFTVGNLDTLQDTGDQALREALLEFFESYYSANVMRLVVLGNRSLDELETLARDKFSPIQNRRVSLKREALPLFPENFLPEKLYIKPLQDQRLLRLTFPVPDFELLYRNKPVDYIAYMLGHEGEGSLLSLLKSKGWAEGLSAGPSVSNRESAAFAISVKLTDEGYRHSDDVVGLVFQAIEKLKRSGMDRWRYNEISVVRNLEFRYQEKTEAINFVSALANNMHYYSPNDIIRGSYRMDKFVDRMIRNYIKYLVPENMLLELNAPEVRTDRVSAFYETEYRLEEIPEQKINAWKVVKIDSALFPPNPNEYIAKQLKIKSYTDRFRGNRGQPRLIKAEENHRLWFLQDEKFRVPKGGINLYAISELTSRSVKNAVLTEMFVRMMRDQLNEQIYSASLAGMDLSIRRRTRGVEFSISGYSDKQSLLLNRAIDVLVKPAFDAERFANLRREWVDELKNGRKKSPYIQLLHAVPDIFIKSAWTDEEQLAEVEKLSLQELQGFTLNWLKSLTIDTFIYGNFTETDALKLSVVIEHNLGLHQQPHIRPESGVVSLPAQNPPPLYPIEALHPDPALLMYVQAADDSEKSQVMMQLLVQVINAPFYHELRTRQQLGYIVFANYYPVSRVPAAAFLVQSPTVGVVELDARITDYLTGFATVLSSMPDEDFLRHKSALQAALAEEPKNLFEQGARHWQSISLDYLGFDHQALLLDALADVDKQALVKFYKTVISGKASRKLLLSTPVSAAEVSGQRPFRLIDDLSAFKQNHMAYPLP